MHSDVVLFEKYYDYLNKIGDSVDGIEASLGSKIYVNPKDRITLKRLMK